MLQNGGKYSILQQDIEPGSNARERTNSSKPTKPNSTATNTNNAINVDMLRLVSTRS